MATLYMMVGLPGSGKSTYIKEANRNGIPVVSSDTIRLEMFGELVQDKNQEVFDEVHRRIENHLANGEDVLFDATNASKRRRRHYVKEIKRKYDCEVIAIVMATPIEQILLNNTMRPYGKQLPWDTLIKKIKTFDIPLFSEGFDDMVINRPDNYSEVNYNFYTVDYDQKSPYHNETLDKHINTTLSYVQEFEDLTPDEYFILSEVARYHDLGKPFCQAPNKHGYMSYYGHDKISAYMYISTNDTVSMDVVAIIQNHMNIMNVNSAKAEKKMIGEIGENNYRLLKLFHEADKYRKEF